MSEPKKYFKVHCRRCGNDITDQDHSFVLGLRVGEPYNEQAVTIKAPAEKED